jgi:cytochrome P450
MWAVMTASEHVLRPGEGGGTVAPIVGAQSFMLTDGELHRSGRRAVVNALRSEEVERYAEMVRSVAERALASWPLDRSVALHRRLRALTLEVILRTVAGCFDGPLDHELRELHACLLDMLDVTANLAFVESRLRHGPGARAWRRFVHDRSRVDQLLHALIRARSRRYTAPDDLIGKLLAQPNPDGSAPSAFQVRDNLISVILAGHETTASQLAWTFQLLAHSPRVQYALIREIRSGTGDAYLSATIQESLRHRCVFVFAIPRSVAAPVEIGDWVYTPPAQLLPCVYLLHHDPHIYRDPDVFRPERFLEAPPDSRTWLPWGGGRKRCPGVHLAQLEMKLVLRTALERMTVEPASRRPERPRWRSVIVTPHAGSLVVLRRHRLHA